LPFCVLEKYSPLQDPRFFCSSFGVHKAVVGMGEKNLQSGYFFVKVMLPEWVVTQPAATAAERNLISAVSVGYDDRPCLEPLTGAAGNCGARSRFLKGDTEEAVVMAAFCCVMQAVEVSLGRR
jgi:hypothetical protein